jgi:hypothetical protein
MRAGINGGTLVRDEVTGFIDTTNIGVYMDMLRTGITAGYLDQVVYCSHIENVTDQADTIIRLYRGRRVPEVMVS